MSAPRHPFGRMRAAFGVLLCALLASPAALVPDVAVAAPQTAATYEAAPCPVNVPAAHRDRVRCGYLTVPERRSADADPERMLRLAVAIVPTPHASAETPLIVSGAALSSLSDFVDVQWAMGDVILVEQRGQVHAEPTLDCPELDLEHFVEDGALLADGPADERRLRQLQRCRDRLVEDGVDLSAYTTAASAADLADLRTALGYDTWDLHGVGEGTRLALTVMRDHPDGLRAVVLDGARPLQANRLEAQPAGVIAAVDALMTLCAAEAACHARYPDLDESLRSVLERAADTPLRVTVDDPRAGSPLRVELSDVDLLATLLAALADPGAVRTVPFVIDQLHRGSDAAIVPLVERGLVRFGAESEGLALTVDCAEEWAFHDVGRIAEARAVDPLLDHLADEAQRARECEMWGVPAAGERENAAVTSGIPTLLLAGGLDPEAPAAAAEATAAALAAAHVVVLPQRGAGALTVASDRCAAAATSLFLQDPAALPDPTCLQRPLDIGFLTTADIHPAPAAYRLSSDLRDAPTRLALGMLLLVALLAVVGYGVAYGLTWLARRRGRAPEGAVLAATVSAAANAAYAIALLVLFTRVEPLSLDLGVPAAAWPLVILPFVGLAAAVVLIVVLVRAWRAGEGATGHRLALSFAALASLGFTVWLVVRGLLVF